MQSQSLFTEKVLPTISGTGVKVEEKSIENDVQQKTYTDGVQYSVEPPQ